MLIFRNAKGVHGKRKVGNPCAKLTTQISKSCGILSKLRHYTTQPVLKAVYNALMHPYLNCVVLNWGRASKITIQPLENLQNKAVKFLKTSKKTLWMKYIYKITF